MWPAERKTHNQAQEPEGVDPDSGRGWRELGRNGWCGRDEDAGPVVVSEYLIDIRKIKCRDILRVWLKILDRDSNKCGDCGRK